MVANHCTCFAPLPINRLNGLMWLCTGTEREGQFRHKAKQSTVGQSAVCLMEPELLFFCFMA